MHAENFVIRNPFNDVEETPPQEKSSDQELVRPIKVTAVRGTPENEKTDNDEDVSGAVKMPSQSVFNSRFSTELMGYQLLSM